MAPLAIRWIVRTVIDTKKATILLVEDSEDDAFFFERTLQKSGSDCVLHRLRDGAAAIDFIRNAAASDSTDFPDLVFLDLKMPILNGFEVLEWLCTQGLAARMRVIVLSGSEHQNDKDRVARLGAADYLVKPVKVHDLDRILRDVCPTNRELGARA